MGYSTRSASIRERWNISKLAIAHPRLTLGFWLAVMVAGLLAFSSLKYALFPDITFPVVVVNATAPFSTAVETEIKLTNLIEQRLQNLSGLDDISSTTNAGQSTIRLAFEVGTNLEAASRLVSAGMKPLQLPRSTTIQVFPLNLNESAAVSYAIQSSNQTLSQLTKITQQQIIPPIAKLPGVLKVELLGDPRSNSSNRPNQAPTLTHFNGKNALALEVIKRGNANTLEVVKQVERAMQQLRLPNVTTTVATTQADYIQEATRSTLDALAVAIALSVLVIFPFLWNWQATLISALAIPTSLLGTFIVMAAFGFNLETITLLALALVVGIIVDDAIVDVENIARHLEAGEPAQQAAIAATNEIGLTVTAATLTIVAVFLPVGLMTGVIGQFFKPFGVTVSAAVIISLLVARTLSPLLAVHWLKPMHREQAAESTGAIAYRNLLQWALSHRYWVIGLALLSLVIGIGLIPLVPKGFIPKLDRGEFNITYTAALESLPAQTEPLQASLNIAQQLEAVVRRSPQVQTVYTIVGSRQGEPNQGKLYVKLRDHHTLPTAKVQDQFRQQLPKIPGVFTSVNDIQFVETGDEKPLGIVLQGNNLQTLTRTAQTIKRQIAAIPGLVDISATEGDSIEHLGTHRVAYISADLTQDAALGSATDQAIAVAQKALPPGVAIDLGGDSARIGEIFGSFGVTLGLSVLCILGVLIFLFRSWIDPFVIVFSLPLSLAGAMVATLVTGSTFGMISVIGIIFLLGLTNKNAILIVDYINQLRRAGLSRSSAILTAAPIRLRPILMTTAATILGMLPLALGWGAGAELRAPMAIAIIGGLIASTLLSLIVVPVVYTCLDDLRPAKRSL